MREQHLYRADIEPVTDEKHRPIWSVMIPTYNCAHYLREALHSVLRQDPGKDTMQIEVIDDHSTSDDPEAVVKEMGEGRIGFFRQPENVGYIRNFETCLQRSSGRLIHLLHADDYVLDGFYRKMQWAFSENNAIGAAFCRHIIMGEDGHWRRISTLEQPQSGVLKNCLERIFVRHPIQTPSIVTRRDVFENLGGFDRRISSSGEDWEMWVRIASNYPVWFEVEPLAVYRSHSRSLSGYAARTGQNLKDIRRAYKIISSYLPKTIVKKLSGKSREFWAFCGLNNAVNMLAAGDIGGAVSQMREALKFNFSLKVMIMSVFYLSLGMAKYFSDQPIEIETFLPEDIYRPKKETRQPGRENKN